MATKRGQALMELAVGMFVIALVVSALCGYALYISKSLKAQNSLRGGSTARSNSKCDTVEVGEFAGEYLFGGNKLEIREKVVMPQTTILK
jgi:hypothetical protein